VTYFYTVAAVDEARNIGKMSMELTSTSLLAAPSGELQLEFVTEVDKLLNEISVVKRSVEEVLENLEGEQKELFDKLGLTKVVENKISELENAQDRVGNFKEQSLTREDLDKKIKREELSLSKTKKEVPENVNVKDKTSFSQVLNEGSLKDVIDKMYIGLEEKEREKMYKESKKNYDKISADVNAYDLMISYLGGEEKSLIFVEKNLEIEEIEGVFSIIEYIPKKVIGSTNDIVFISDDYVIINEDPIIQWDTDYIAYYTSNEVNLEKFRDTLVVLLPEKDMAYAESNQITGFSVFGDLKGGPIGLIFSIIILLILAAYYFFVLKGIRFSFSNDRIEGMIKKSNKWIDQGLLSAAQKGYTEISKEYSQLDNEKKKKYLVQIKALMEKINLTYFRYACYQLNKSLPFKNMSLIEKKYGEVKKTYPLLSKENQTKFEKEMKDAEESFEKVKESLEEKEVEKKE
jgi:hypothetical protein